MGEESGPATTWRHDAMTEASSDAFERLFQAHPLPVIVYDPVTLAIRYVNEAAADYYGQSRGALEQARLVTTNAEVASEPTAKPVTSASNGAPASVALPTTTLASNDVCLAGRTYRVAVIDPAPHRATDAAEHRRQLRCYQQQHCLTELAQEPAIAEGRFPEAFDALLRAAARALGVRRLGFWRVTRQPPGLRCDRLYDSVHERISGGMFLDGDQCPTYMAATVTSRVIDVADAMHDPRLVELREYLRDNQIGSLLDAPVRVRGEVVGVLCHEHVGERRDWGEDEIRFAGEIADQLAQALLNAQRRRYQELLRGMASLVGPETGDRFCRALVTNVAHLLDGACVFVARIDPDNRQQAQTLAIARDGALATNISFSLDHPLCTSPMRDGVEVISHDLRDRHPDLPWGSGADGESYIGIRLEDHEGTVLGLLGAVGREPVAEDEDTVALLRVFADRAAVELARIRREPHLLRAAAVLNNTSEGIAATRDDGLIVDANPALSELTGYSTEALEAHSLFELIIQPPPETIRDAISRDGRWRGEVATRGHDGSDFPAWLTVTRIAPAEAEPTHIRLVALLSDMSRVRASQAELEHLAHRDPLTELPNRSLLHDRLERTIENADRRGESIALLFLDLDGFKDINDSLGHTEGDRLINGVAQRLADVVRDGDTLARIGGDEFVVLLDELTDEASAEAAASRMLEVFHHPFRVAGHDLFMTVSVGISIFPRDGEGVESLIQSADAAMYDAKASGKNTFRFFMPSLTQNAFERVALLSALRSALEHGEFFLCFQSQVVLADGRLSGCEALLRWQRPSGEITMPSEFIPLAERSGLIMTIGQWVLEAACQQALAWLNEGLAFGRVAVNVAATQISQSGFAEDLLGILERTGLPAECLTIEITESLFLEPQEAVEHALALMRGAGIEIAIDDFGTGYSSLAYLKHLPIDTVKLDKSFTGDIPDNPDSVSIAQAIVALASNLGLSVIAEGVETTDQELFLETLHCARAQGFRYSHPMPATEFARMLRGNEPKLADER